MLFPLLTSTKLHRFPIVVASIVMACFLYFLKTHTMLLLYAPKWGFVLADSAGEMFASLTQLHILQTTVTYAFLHAGWSHLLCNMWMLVVFGVALEMRVGCWRFILIYLLSAFFSVLCEGIFQIGAARPVIGASGAIAGVLGCYLALEPRSRVLSLFFLGIIFFVTEVPSFFYVGIWLFLQIDGIQMHFLTGPDYRNIAWWAHLGGFVFGFGVGLAIRVYEKHRQSAT